MKNNSTIWWLKYIFVMAFLYAGYSFYYLNLDFRDWHQDARLGYFLCVFILLLVFNAADALNSGKDTGQ